MPLDNVAGPTTEDPRMWFGANFWIFVVIYLKMGEKDFLWGWEGRLLGRETGEDRASSLTCNEQRAVLDDRLDERNERMDKRHVRRK